MKKIKIILAALAIAVMSVAPTAWANSLTFQGVTFDLSINGAGNLVLALSGSGTGNYTGITSLDSFAIQNYGTATGLSIPTWTTIDGGLNANGCNGTGNFTCFTKAGGVTFSASNINASLTISHTGGTFDLTAPPSLKVVFDINGTPCAPGCDLLSQPIPVGTSVPEPASLLLLGAGLAGVGIWRRQSGKI